MFDRLAGERDGARVMTALRQRWWVIVLVAVVAGAAAHVLANQQAKKYSASSGLLFLNSSLSQELVGKQIINNADPARQAATNQSLVELPSVARLVAAQLKVPVVRIESEVVFGSVAQSDVLQVTITDPLPGMAAAIANAYVQQYIQFRKAAAENQLSTAETLIKSKLAAIPRAQQTSPVAQALISDRNQLDLLKSAQTGDAEVVQTAIRPKAPSFPNPTRDSILGALLGLLVGGALVALLERRDRRIKTPAEVAAIYGVPVIGSVPESPRFRGARAPTRLEEEAFLMIRAQLRYFDVDRHIRRVMVSSAESGEGKSVVSLNLARAAARTVDQRALLIEADLRRPSLHRMIGLDSAAGLAELLSQSQDMESGIKELVVSTHETDEPERPLRLDILLAGSIPPNPVELLESTRMTQLLEQADAMYDLVIIDTPPIGLVSDAIPLVHQVDGMLVVSRMNYSHRDRAVRLMTRLSELNANVLGTVVNSIRRDADASYGYYGNYSTRPATSEDRRMPRSDRSVRTR